MRNFLRRLINRKLDYSTRYHMQTRFQSLDFRFLGAVAVLVIAVLLVMRFY